MSFQLGFPYPRDSSLNSNSQARNLFSIYSRETAEGPAAFDKVPVMVWSYVIPAPCQSNAAPFSVGALSKYCMYSISTEDNTGNSGLNEWA